MVAGDIPSFCNLVFIIFISDSYLLWKFSASYSVYFKALYIGYIIENNTPNVPKINPNIID